jgi:hypothetical protein
MAPDEPEAAARVETKDRGNKRTIASSATMQGSSASPGFIIIYAKMEDFLKTILLEPSMTWNLMVSCSTQSTLKYRVNGFAALPWLLEEGV